MSQEKYRNGKSLEMLHPYFGFSQQGKRIKKNSSYRDSKWDLHLNNTKEVIRNYLTKTKEISRKKSIAILGAGSLLDVPEELFKLDSYSIYLQDANPDCTEDWDIKTKIKSEKTTVNYCILDITGQLNQWSSELLHKNPDSLKSALKIIKELETKRTNEAPFIKSNHCISLNILSQLPVYWQDFVFAYLEKKFGKHEVKSEETKILQSLTPSCKVLIQNHLEQILPKKKNDSSLLIADTCYYYTPKNVSASVTDKNITSPLYFKSDAPVLKVEEQDALFSISLNSWHKEISKYIETNLIDTWVWNIRNDRKQSIFHKVSAIEYRRR